MFITRFTQEQREELTVLRERCAQLGAQLASSRTSQEWLETRVTSLEMERAALTERLLAVSYPVPVIQRTNERPAGKVESYGRPLDDSAYVVPPHLRGAVAPHPPMVDTRPPRPDAGDEVGGSISALQAEGMAFEDMGDDAAAAEGIRHNDAGAVEYSR